jgi:hypothetical protein
MFFGEKGRRPGFGGDFVEAGRTARRAPGEVRPRSAPVPEAGLTRAGVIGAGARLADDVGFHNLGMASLAKRLSVRTPPSTSASAVWPTCGTASRSRP